MALYRYYITLDGKQVEIQPKTQQLQKLFSRRENTRFSYTSEVKGKVVIDRKQDFNMLLAIERSSSRCKSIPIRITQVCGQQENTHTEGILSLIKGKWDIDRCEVEIPIDAIDVYECYELNKDKEINLFDASSDRLTVNHIRGEIQRVIYDSGGEGDAYSTMRLGPNPQASGWQEYKRQYFFTRPSTPWTFSYAREIVFVQPGTQMTADWIYIGNTPSGDNYARRVVLTDFTWIDPNGETPSAIQAVGARRRIKTWKYEVFGTEEGEGIFDNGLALKNILPYYVNKYCGLKFQSDFFQINPASSTDINYVTKQPSKVTNLVVFQKSDVKRPTATGNATIATTTLDKLIQGLCNTFNLQYRIENETFILEHVSYFGKTVGLDLTGDRYDQYIRGKFKYSYQTEKLPKFEKFLAMEASNKDFVGLPIEYTGGCVTTEESAKDKEFKVEDFSYDVEFIVANGDEDSNLVRDEGLVIIAAVPYQDKLYIITEQPILDTAPHVNNSLAWAQLHRDYWKHERAQSYGYMNGVYTQFESSIPVKKQDKIVIPFCCGDSISLVNFVRSQLGDGIVDTATFDFYQETMELNLVFTDDYNAEAECIKPKKFAFNHRTGADFFFDSEFYVQDVDTETEVTYPNGLIRIIADNEADGVNLISVPDLVAGNYSFRKRVRCSSSAFSDWTDFVRVQGVTIATPPPPCVALGGSLIATGRGAGGSFTFLYSPNDLTSNIQIEINRPQGGGQYVVYEKPVNAVRIVLNQVTFGVDVFKAPFPAVIEKGRWGFRIRRVCDANIGLYSAWSNYAYYTV